MGHVKGIGGLFFRARDPEALSAWYRDRLGVGGGCTADDSAPVNQWVWTVTGGPLVFSPFQADTGYFPADRQFMINLRVDDLDAVLAPFRAAGEAIVTKAEWDDSAVGRFARVHDPEGNPIELWEPPAG
ncbi:MULTISPECIES: VOC family protein [Sphingopyxis]|uniref:VOC family protein n=1 Tax=Sphingopyxis TaxID=165697 RepID=UPI000869FAAE|nr:MULTISPECIES: VOC family protein [Sphingopyxis]APW73415.1 glyoxalase [Sphingopyxis granuli]AVA14445.1 VOC family protein [Sphingopyxis sp. MG]ODU29057.1 MAG: glyoxalase [Sphingopyxis sp. SCN 67-31]